MGKGQLSAGHCSRIGLLSVLLLTTVLLSGCVHSGARAPAEQLQHHTNALADGLFTLTSPSSVSTQPRIGIGSIVPVQSLRQQGDSRDRLLVQQIQEGLMSAAVQRGAQIVEYRTSAQLRLEDGQELMLSRDVAELSNRQRIDYFLTGTYSEISGGLVVNLRLIHVHDNRVTQATSHFFPWTSLGEVTPHSEMRHGDLYRHPVTASPFAPQPGAAPMHRSF